MLVFTMSDTQPLLSVTWIQEKPMDLDMIDDVIRSFSDFLNSPD